MLILAIALLPFVAAPTVQANNFAAEPIVAVTTDSNAKDRKSTTGALPSSHNDARQVEEVRQMNQKFSQIKTTLMFFSLGVLIVIAGCVIAITYIYYKKYKETKSREEQKS